MGISEEIPVATVGRNAPESGSDKNDGFFSRSSAFRRAVSALDYQTRLSVCDDLYEIIKNEKKTTLLVTHDISEALSTADRIIVLTKRPSKILNIHMIDLDKSVSPLKRREDPHFSKWFERLWRELNYEKK